MGTKETPKYHVAKGRTLESIADQINKYHIELLGGLTFINNNIFYQTFVGYPKVPAVIPKVTKVPEKTKDPVAPKDPKKPVKPLKAKGKPKAKVTAGGPSGIPQGSSGISEGFIPADMT